MKKHLPGPDDVGGLPWRTLFVATVAGYLLIAGVLLTVGEWLTNASAMASTRSWDLDVSRWFVDHRSSMWDTITEIGSRSADTFGILALAAIVEVVLVVRRRSRELVLIAVGLLLEITSFLTVNLIVDRPRPDVERLGSTPSTASFPSGHTAAVLVTWACIVVLIRRDTALTVDRRRITTAVATVIGTVMVLVVAISRVYRGMHHVTDVVGGAVMGAACVGVAVFVVRRVDPRPVAIPSAEQPTGPLEVLA